jgi:putative ABC transport system substrate-binding protein
MQAQQSKMPVIGVLSVDDPAPLLGLLREGLRERGYVEGQNLRIEVRSGPGKGEVLRPLADELVRLKVEVIVARLTPAVQAAKAATQTIPIVMAPAGAPVETGLIASLARPGGNVTGLSRSTAELGGKRMQLIREMLPNAQRIAILANPADPFTKPSPKSSAPARP